MTYMRKNIPWLPAAPNVPPHAVIHQIMECLTQPKGGITPGTDNGFFYKALSYVSYDMDETALLGLLDEAENMERDIKSGEMQNDKENNKN